MANEIEDFLAQFPSEAEQNTFMATLGKAVSAWQYVETSLYLVYETAIQPRHHEALAASFHMIQTFNVKLMVADMAVRYVLFSNSIMTEEWSKLQDRFREKNDRRNELVHLSAVVKPRKKSLNEAMRLEPQLFDARYRSGLRRMVSHGMSEIATFEQIFIQLAENLRDFSGRLGPISRALPPKYVES